MTEKAGSYQSRHREHASGLLRSVLWPSARREPVCRSGVIDPDDLAPRRRGAKSSLCSISNEVEIHSHENIFTPGGEALVKSPVLRDRGEGIFNGSAT